MFTKLCSLNVILVGKIFIEKRFFARFDSRKYHFWLHFCVSIQKSFFTYVYIFLSFSECIDKCTINEKTGRIPACAYICEMTHGYENLEFLETINCLVDNKCLNEYPKGEVFSKKKKILSWRFKKSKTIIWRVFRKISQFYITDGICYGEDSEAVQTIKNLNQV